MLATCHVEEKQLFQQDSLSLLPVDLSADSKVLDISLVVLQLNVPYDVTVYVESVDEPPDALR